MAEQKQCKQCQAKFTVEDEDLAFYKKISPTFAGRTFEVPAPTLCPECRQLRRLIWRNETHFYKRKCDKSGREIVTIIAPDKTDYKVFANSEWWRDDWDAVSFGHDYDEGKPFFEQFGQLIKDVPRLALYNTNTENSEYTNYAAEVKDCYMSVAVYEQTEKTHYSNRVLASSKNIDCENCDHIDNCYECTYCNNSYGCKYSIRLNNCRDCYFSADLNGCSDCVFCTNLTRKQHCIENKQYSPEEYKAKLEELNLGLHSKVEEHKKRFEEIRSKAFVKYANLTNCEGCTGDDLVRCKNSKLCFVGFGGENVKYSWGFSDKTNNVLDFMGGSIDYSLECNHVGYGANVLFSSTVLYSSNMIYCENCYNCSDCFGCVGLRHKKYCILNKQYSKEEYEGLVAKIVEKMQASQEWGEFFPCGLSPFGLNESLAGDYLEISKEKAAAFGAKWQEKTFEPQYSGEFLVPEDDVAQYIADPDLSQKLLQGVIKCEASGRPFKIIPQELAFYLDNKVPVPRYHYEERHKRRMKLRNLPVLHHRQCMCEEGEHGHEGRCSTTFETTYNPDRPERVYCEQCYQKSVV